MKKLVRWWAATTTTMMIIAVTSLSGPTAAKAETTPGLIGYDPEHITALGTFKPNGFNQQMLCIDARMTNPTQVTAAVKQHAPFVAYASFVYQQTKDPDVAAGYAVAVGRKINTNVAALEAALNALPAATKAKVGNIAAQITAEAEAFQGPYNLPLKINGNAENYNATGTIEEIGVRAAATQRWVPGLGATVTLTNATFDDGTNTKNITTGNNPQTLTYKATANGTVAAKLTVHRIPPVEILVFGPQSDGYQRVIVSVDPTSADVTVSNVATTTWKPTIVTKLAVHLVGPGQEIIDIGVAGNGRPNAKFSGKFDFYLTDTQPVESATIPKEAKPFASVPYTATFDKNGVAKNIKAKTLAPEKSGSKYFTIVASINPDPIIGLAGYTSKWAEAPETGRIVDVKLTSKVGGQESLYGVANTDTWLITDIVEKYGTQTVTYEAAPALYGPLERVNGKCPVGIEAWAKAGIEKQWEAKPIKWDEHQVDGLPGKLDKNTLTVKLGEHKPKTGDACYSYAGTLTVKLGDTVLAKIIHPVGEETQGFYVPAADGGDSGGDEINAGQTPTTAPIAAVIGLLGAGWITRKMMI